MKHRKYGKVGILALSLLVSILLALLVSCGNESGGRVESLSVVYEEAQGHGYQGTLDEFITLLKGNDGADGEDGVGIKKMHVDGDGHLIASLTDGSTVDCGFVRGEDGEKGEDGANGQNGANGKDGIDGGNGKSAYELAVENGFVGTETEWLDKVVDAAVKELVESGKTIDEATVRNSLEKISDELAECFETIRKPAVDELTPALTDGYLDLYGTSHKNNAIRQENFGYTDFIAVEEGDVITLVNGTMRYVSAYCESAAVSKESKENVASYTVPAGVDAVRLSYTKSDSAKVTHANKKPVVVMKEDACPDDLMLLLCGKLFKNSEAIVTTMLGADIVTAEEEKMKSGDVIYLGKNVICNDKHLTFSADLTSCGTIRIGHGKDYYNGNYIEISGTTLTVYSYSTALNTVKTVSHGLVVSGYVNVVIDVKRGYADISVSTPTGICEIKDVSWLGRNGEIFAEVEDCTLTNVKMTWNCEGYSYKLWAFGDSYFNPTDPSRWPSYLGQNGYTHNLLFGYSGMGSSSALADFKQALEHGTPEYAVWCMGMNDADPTSSQVNSTWLACVQEFLKLCEEHGITPILSTIPCVPIRDNTAKNKWVKNSGYRYIDFARAVGGEKTGSSWYPDMLYTGDNVHPAQPGAKALYMQAIADCPEFMDD